MGTISDFPQLASISIPNIGTETMHFPSNMFLHVNRGWLRGWQKKSVLYSLQGRNLKIGKTQYYLHRFGNFCLKRDECIKKNGNGFTEYISQKKTLPIGPTLFWMIKEVHLVLIAKNECEKCKKMRSLPKSGQLIVQYGDEK